jgi:hypothetical protein
MKKSQYSTTDRSRLIEACENSGLSRAEWCRRNKIPYNRFVWWLKSRPESAESERRFVQIQPPAVLGMVTQPIEVRIKDQIIITVPSVEVLQAILPGLMQS